MRAPRRQRWFRLPARDDARTEADVEAELSAHLEERVRRLMGEGLSEAAARAEAERRLGGWLDARRRLVGAARARDTALARRELVRGWAEDVAYGARVLRRDRGFSLVAIVSLGLAFALVAATTALVDAYLLRAMPYPEADRLYHVHYSPPGEREPEGLSALDWTALNGMVEHADNSAPARFYTGSGVDRAEVSVLLVAAGSLDLLGVRAVHGRTLVTDDFAPGAEPVALVGHHVWQARFGGDSAIIGRTLTASRASGPGGEERFRIVGVLPEDFRYARSHVRGAVDYVVALREPLRAYMVRLRAGVPPEHAQHAIDDAVRRTATRLPSGWRGVRLESIHDAYTASVRPTLLAITAAGAIVLTITSVNVAVLMLLRALRRRKEWAVRASLGASRGRLIRLQLTESAMVCGAALLVGVAIAGAALRALAPAVEERLGREAPAGTLAIAMDGRVFLIVGAAGVVVALLLAAVPLLAPWQRRLAEVLRAAGRGATDGSVAQGARAALLAFQVAASLALVVGCGLMVRTVLHLAGADLGYETEGVVRARIALPPESYTDAPSFLRFHDQLTARLEDAPTPIATTTIVPFWEPPQQRLEVEGSSRADVDAVIASVDGRWFDVLGVPLRHGRVFTRADRPGAPAVAIISATLAARLGPPGSVLGRRIRIAAQEPTGAADEWRTVVGVVDDVRQTPFDTDLDDLYVPFAQAPAAYAPVYARTSQPPLEWLADLRAHVAAIDPLVLVTGDAVSSSLRVQNERILAGPRFLMSVLTGFALFSALLTAIGVYGVTAYAVRQRERELAIRAAVGATRRHLVHLFIADGARIVAAGLLVGLLGAFAAGRLLRHQLHGVQALDPLVLSAAGVSIAIVALVSCWWPAARAGSGSAAASLLNEG